MYIERLQIEEGFLNGLDVNLTTGLNVIIGARGTGKTSLIELIRFCLDVKGSVQDSAKKSREHALSILGSGQVNLTLSTNGQQIMISRTASDAIPRSSGIYNKPIIFSQTEIETIGLEASGRLQLIDSFIPIQLTNDTEEQKLIANIVSLTTEAASIRKEVEEMESSLLSSANVESELKNVIDEETTVSQGSQIIQAKAIALQKLSENISSAASNQAVVTRAQTEVYSWYEKIKTAFEYPINSQNDASNILNSYLQETTTARNSLQGAHDLIAQVWHSLESNKKSIEAKKLQDEAEARELRVQIESLQEGAGNVMRKGQELREKKARRDSTMNHHSNRKIVLTRILEKRSEELECLEKLRYARFSERYGVIQQLNTSLAPTIRLGIKRNGQQNQYSSLLADLLRGSGLRYGDLVPILASTVSPRILLEAVENFDVNLISSISSISADRVSRILSHLRAIDLSTLGTLDIEDEVSMALLDGCNYKDISMLSTGQRCTVVLPIVLSHKERIVIVDQPEDHIDNAFIANTLIQAILSRDSTSQILFSTHNPNIPVLGNADNVIHLASDGKKGYVDTIGKLNHEQVVESISTVMEGGTQAFAKRSDFYSQFPL